LICDDFDFGFVVTEISQVSNEETKPIEIEETETGASGLERIRG
jgi:hypothetical protein